MMIGKSSERVENAIIATESFEATRKEEDARTLPVPRTVHAAIEHLCETVDQEQLAYEGRLAAVAEVRRRIVPRRKPGKKSPNIDSAWPDFQRGLRGLPLYQKHIPDHQKMNQYRRSAEENRLRDGLRKRARRKRP